MFMLNNVLPIELSGAPLSGPPQPLTDEEQTFMMLMASYLSLVNQGGAVNAGVQIALAQIQRRTNLPVSQQPNPADLPTLFKVLPTSVLERGVPGLDPSNLVPTSGNAYRQLDYYELVFLLNVAAYLHATVLPYEPTAYVVMVSQIQVRLNEAIAGMTEIRPIQGPVAQHSHEVDRLFVDGHRLGAVPQLVDAIWAHLN